jgi:hypothetical protein
MWARSKGSSATSPRSALSRLRRRDLAEGDGERPPGFARTWRGEIVLEHVTWREHVVAVRG